LALSKTIAIAFAVLTSLVSQRCCASLGSLGQVDLQEAILRDHGLVAAHLSTVRPAAFLSLLVRVPSTGKKRGLLTASQSARSVIARDALKLADTGLGARIPGEPLIACLVLAIVDPGADHGPSRHDHEEEADDHIANTDDIVDIEVVAADAQRPVIAGRVVMDMLRITVFYPNGRH